MSTTHPRQVFTGLSFATAMASILFLVAGCSDGSDTIIQAPDPVDPPTSSEVTRGEDPPGVDLTITGLSGATGAGGNFRVGDTVSVTFTVEKGDGTAWDLAEMNYGRFMISGPTFNYQRVLPEERDGLTASVANPNGSWTYTFPDPIPATYAAPINDTPSFGPEDGELTGQSLLDGTYTVGAYFGWGYTVDHDSFRDVDNETMDFLVGGGAGPVMVREVVKLENCNQCHESLRLHGTLRREVGLCVLCHTSGAEDKNPTDVAGGTPGVTIDFRVMIHKIHNGEHLPSVNGVATNPDGTRNYAATPKPYQVLGYRNSIHDYSHVGFPAFPNLALPMPRDTGYSTLAPGERAQEDEMRRGVTDCAVCHGDPDGAGPLEAPAQGDLIYSQPSRRACGACHDDIDWALPYGSNTMTMPPQSGDSSCTACHGVGGSALAIQDAHLHPLRNSAENPGLNFQVRGVAEAGIHDNDGTIDPSEKIAVTFTITDGQGADVNPADLGSMSLVVSGPTNNSNMLLNMSSFPRSALSGPQPFTVNVPQLVFLEYVEDQDMTPSPTDTFQSAMAPHWDITGAATTVYVPTVTATSTLSDADVEGPQNYIDVADASGFARDDYVVVISGMPQVECLRIQLVEGNRLWFASPYQTDYAPGMLKNYSIGSTVQLVTLAEATVGTDYILDAATGLVTEVGNELGDSQMLVVSYTTDFVLPSTFGLGLNHTVTLNERSGRWTGKSLVDGTYVVTMWGYRNLSVTRFGETTTYRGTGEATHADFLVGSATTMAPYDLIASAESCNTCHQELRFHGGSRAGFDSCISCHGTAGSEDRPQYRAANAPQTPGLTVNFRTMLHKIHMGHELTNASTYTIVGYGGGYPNNFSEHTYENVGFPGMPGGVRNCTKCHGDSNESWLEPSNRNHPTEQGMPVLAWTVTCGACHDSDAAQAHFSAQTSPINGSESCAICHGEGEEWNVRLVHKIY